jgi:hypothetical protein
MTDPKASTPDSAHAVVRHQLNHLKSLVDILPSSIALATHNDRISTVFTNIPVPKETDDHWMVFNRRLDALFGEDLRNADGRLPNVLRGPFGMDMVVQYIEDVVAAGHLLWEPTKPKLERLISEMQAIMYVFFLYCYLVFHKQPCSGPATKIKLRIPAKRKTSITIEEEEDKDYAPPKRPREEPTSPVQIFRSDGEELTEQTEMGEILVRENEAGQLLS